MSRLWDGSPARPDEHVSVQVSRSPEGDLVVEIDAPLHGDPAPSAPSGPTWELWNHEVVELFLLGDDDAYTEIEVGPHGHHLVLQLEGRRNVVRKLLPLDVQVLRSGGRWTARAIVPPALVPAGLLKANAYAIHGVDNDRRYLACTPVPGDAPDFHRIGRFLPLDL